MNPGAYLKSHLGLVLLLLGTLALLTFVMEVAGGRSFALLGLIIGSVGLVCGLSLDYLAHRGWWRRLECLPRELDNPRLVAALAEAPGFAEGDVAYEAIAASNKSASDEVAAARRQMSDYERYVEMWVHEVKTPLAAVHLTVENLMADPAEAQTDPARLDSIDAGLRRIEGYVDQALYVARSETLEADYLIRAHRVGDVVTAALKANARELIAAHMAPRLGGGMDLTVLADDKWLGFVLGQFLQNSIRYLREGAEGGSQVSFSARVEGEGLASERVVLVVRDNGCGVSPAELPRVFERGFTGANGRTHKGATGLGLWLAKMLCEKMGLSISADSREGAWFEVSIAFPTNKMHYVE